MCPPEMPPDTHAPSAIPVEKVLDAEQLEYTKESEVTCGPPEANRQVVL